MSDFVISKAVSGAAFCGLQQIENMPEPLDLLKGVSLQPWPGNVRLHMDPNFPKAIQLPDWVKNLPNAIVVAPRLKAFVESERPADVEYLPVSIIDHKGRVASADYFVLNPYRLQDCIDQKASVIDWNPIDPELISACTTMVIDESRIDDGAKIFRLKHYPSKVLLARDLANAIKKSGFTGIKFIEIEDLEY